VERCHEHGFRGNSSAALIRLTNSGMNMSPLCRCVTAGETGGDLAEYGIHRRDLDRRIRLHTQRVHAPHAGDLAGDGRIAKSDRHVAHAIKEDDTAAAHFLGGASGIEGPTKAPLRCESLHDGGRGAAPNAVEAMN
jgi:hypothetical protein